MVFKKGQIGNPKGRPVGSKNKYTEIKDEICRVFLARKAELRNVPMSKLINFVGQTAPKETKVEFDKPIVVKWED